MVKMEFDHHMFMEVENMSSVSAYANGVNDVKETETASKKTNVSGRTIGKPELSEKAAKYYESLKKKYNNMDFILVSKDQKEQAKAQAASYANSGKMVVLIDEEKIERMAEDEKFRNQYEGIIRNAATGMNQLKKEFQSSGTEVKGFGMQVNDNGTASYFAVLKKSSADQKARIEKKAEQKKADKKAEEKKAAKKELEERIKEGADEKDDTVTISANSIEALIQKISDYTFAQRSDNIQTESEKQIGQNFDFRG